MGEIQKLVRSKSVKLLGALENVLNLPVTLDKQFDSGENLARALSRRFSKKEEEEFEAGFTGETVPLEGKLEEKLFLETLSCQSCGELCGPPLLHCRKGHLYCSHCRASSNRTCRTCKQAVGGETPYNALDKLLSLIALPCRYSSLGCPEVLFLNVKPQHETSVCRFRPVACENASRGCGEVLPYKDINLHQRNCINRQKLTKQELDVKSPVKRKSVSKPLKTSLKVTTESPEIKIEFCDNITLD